MAGTKPITPQPALVTLLFAIMVVAGASLLSTIGSIRPTIDEAIGSPYVSQTALGVFRLSAAIFILGIFVSLRLDPKGLTFPVRYLPQSKMLSLGAAKSITLVGWSRLSPFTIQSWGLLGLYFLLAGLSSLAFRDDAAHAPLAPYLAVLLLGLFNLLYP
eukprot:1789726-Pyramimonas_sp.AAC.1